MASTTLDQDFSAELKTVEWKTEANVLKALGELGHTTEHQAIFDDLDLLRHAVPTVTTLRIPRQDIGRRTVHHRQRR